MNLPESPNIGWIGTGRMGHAMAARLLKAGESVHIWNRTRSKAEDLAEYGGVIVDSVAKLAGLDVVFIMVSADKDLLEVTLGEGGVLTQLEAPKILVDSSTVTAATSAKVRAAAAERGVRLLIEPIKEQ